MHSQLHVLGKPVVWGYGQSWVVHVVNGDGHIVWQSPWMRERGVAEDLRKRMERAQ